MLKPAKSPLKPPKTFIKYLFSIIEIITKINKIISEDVSPAIKYSKINEKIVTRYAYISNAFLFSTLEKVYKSPFSVALFV